MFQLVVVVCMTASACETVRVPIPYPTEARCAGQAAIVAGMVRARARPSRTLNYTYTCSTARKAPQATKGQVASKER